MAVLLAGSGFFSGSETAFFSISRRQITQFKQCGTKVGTMAAALLARPKKLLTALLFANMAVNVLYVALASVVSMNFGSKLHPSAGGISAFLAFILLLLFGEMLPKSLALNYSRRICLLAAPGCYICTKLLSPMLTFFDWAIVAPAVRLIVGPVHSDSQAEHVTVEQMKLLIESSLQQSQADIQENQLYSAVVEMALLKVRHVMKSRVDMVSCRISTPLNQAKQQMLEGRTKRIAVYEENIDNVVGTVSLKNILLNEDKDLKQLIDKANFVPEHKTLESLLDFFKSHSADTAIVVDEYGGIAGIILLDDVIDEIVGPTDFAVAKGQIEQIGPLRYRIGANMSIHDWAMVFDIDPGQSRLATIGGLVTATIGRIPKPGDKARYKNIEFEVEKVRANRIESVVLSLESIME